MTQGQSIGLVWAVGWIALVGSALLARDIPRGRMLKMAAIWIIIFGLGWLIVSFAAGNDRTSTASPTAVVPSQGI